MDALVRQVTELLGGNQRSVWRHADACLPTPSSCSEFLVASHIRVRFGKLLGS
jgi:hypothetical protein